MDTTSNNSTANQKVVCPHCEAQVLPSQKELELLVRTMEISIDEKTPENIYKKRLEQCGRCEYLHEKIICMQCGCYVKIRALYLDNNCPNPKKSKW